jgi:hypothetical protein
MFIINTRRWPSSRSGYIMDSRQMNAVVKFATSWGKLDHRGGKEEEDTIDALVDLLYVFFCSEVYEPGMEAPDEDEEMMDAEEMDADDMDELRLAEFEQVVYDVESEDENDKPASKSLPKESTVQDSEEENEEEKDEDEEKEGEVGETSKKMLLLHPVIVWFTACCMEDSLVHAVPFKVMAHTCAMQYITRLVVLSKCLRDGPRSLVNSATKETQIWLGGSSEGPETVFTWMQKMQRISGRHHGRMPTVGHIQISDQEGEMVINGITINLERLKSSVAELIARQTRALQDLCTALGVNLLDMAIDGIVDNPNNVVPSFWFGKMNEQSEQVQTGYRNSTNMIRNNAPAGSEKSSLSSHFFY